MKKIKYRVSNPEPMSISEITKKIIDGKWVLAPFQRPKKWEWKNHKLLLESLVEKIPIGCAYIWRYNKNKNYPVRQIPGIKYEIDKVEALILDGQQRLSFLAWLIIKLDNPDFEHGPTHQIHYNLEKKQFINKLNQSEELQKFIINIHKFADPEHKIYIKDEIKKIDKTKYDDNNWDNLIDRIDSIFHSTKIAIQEVADNVSQNFTFKLYDNVNKSGVKLQGIDYIEAALFNVYPGLHDDIQNEVNSLSIVEYPTIKEPNNKEKYYAKIFTRTNFIRCLIDYLYHIPNPQERNSGDLSLITDFENPKYTFDKKNKKLYKDGKIDKAPKLTKKVIKEALKDITKSFELLKDILIKELYILQPKGLNSTFVIPASALIRTHRKAIDEDKKFKGNFFRWIILFHLHNTYVGSQDNKIKKDCDASRTAQPFDEIFKLFSSRLGKTIDEVKINKSIYGFNESSKTLEVMSPNIKEFAQHLHLFIAINKNAEDWFKNYKLKDIKRNLLEKHHIVAKDICEENEIPPEKYNHIANLARIEKSTNASLSNKKLSDEEYLERIIEHKKEHLNYQQIPMDKSLWEIDNFDAFLEKRIELLCEAGNQLLNNLKKGDWTIKAPSKGIDYNKIREDQKIEFKETALMMKKVMKYDKKFINSTICKVINGMMNTNGGKIIIGIVDKPREILGIEKEIDVIKEKYPDHDEREKYEKMLREVLKKHFKPKEYTDNIYIEYDMYENKTLMIIGVFPSKSEVILNEFYHYKNPEKKWLKEEDVVFKRTGEETVPYKKAGSLIKNFNNWKS